MESTISGAFPGPCWWAEFGVSRSHPPAVRGATRHHPRPGVDLRGARLGLVHVVLQDLNNMGIVTVRPDSPWRRFLDSPRIADFMRRYKELEGHLPGASE